MRRTTDHTSTELILATDLDGTFAGNTVHERTRLQRALRGLDRSTLIYVTGRSVPSVRELIDEAALPHPDYLIADVGTTVVDGGSFAHVGSVESWIAESWPGAGPVRERLASVQGIAEQDVPAPRRVSYWLTGAPMLPTLERMAERLAGLDVDLLGSADTYIDVLPGGVNKGTTLLRLLRWLGAPAHVAVVAGDTMNDLALFETGLRGIVVANCEPELRARLAGREHLYFSAGEGAAGVLEGLLHFGCIEDPYHAE